MFNMFQLEDEVVRYWYLCIMNKFGFKRRLEVILQQRNQRVDVF